MSEFQRTNAKCANATTTTTNNSQLLGTLLLLICMTMPADALFVSHTTSRTMSTTTSMSPSFGTKSVRIRATIESDLAPVGKMLAQASLSPTSKGFQAKMDLLLAQYDIEQLLSTRWKAIQEGRKQIQRFPRHEQGDGVTTDNLSIGRSTTNSDRQSRLVNKVDSLSVARLSTLWNSASFRKLVGKASTDTGEDNVWRRHDFELAPPSTTWLQHIQMTAVSSSTNGRGKAVVVGFCEVAMLANPLKATAAGSSASSNPSSEEQRPSNSKDLTAPLALVADASSVAFSPAILNLGVDPRHRRQGIAKHLLSVTERYARREWKAQSLGLYVQPSNDAALQLYKSLGYRQAACVPSRSDDCIVGETLYMVKEL
jgi:GNAT superfamily N-acetyltransferase